jgi:hypothetical protein
MSKLRRKPSPDLTAYQWTGDENTIPPWVKEEGVKCSNNKLYVPNLGRGQAPWGCLCRQGQ